MRLSILSIKSAFLLFWVPQAAFSLRHKSKEVFLHGSTRRRYLQSWMEVVERIECVPVATEFNSLLAIQLIGSLRENSTDAEALGALLVDTYKQESALGCDPYQRTLIEATFNRVYSLPGVFESFALYNVRAVSNAGKPAETVLEPEQDPPLLLDSQKQPTGQTCSIADILLNSSCPFEGCYCPADLLSSPTAGVTEAQLAESLNSNLNLVVAGSQRTRKPLRTLRSSAPYSASKIRKSKCSKAPASVNQIPVDSMFPGVTSIPAVAEVQQIAPCPAAEIFESTVVTFMSTDPCELGADVLLEFLNSLVEEYNKAQFESCDFSFRRIVDFEIVDTCSSNSTRRSRTLNRKLVKYYSFPWKTRTKTSSERRLTTTNRGRRNLSKDKASSTLLSNDASSGVYRFLQEDDSLCLCSAFVPGPTSGVTEEEFTALADASLQAVTNGTVQVLDQYEAVPTTCGVDLRVDFDASGSFELSVNRSALTTENIRDLEEACILGYNSYIIDKCTEFFYHVQECKLVPPCAVCRDDNWYDFYLTGSMIEGPENDGFSFSTNSARFLEEERELSYLTWLPEDVCLCRSSGKAPGINPSEAQFTKILNTITSDWGFNGTLVRETHIYDMYPGFYYENGFARMTKNGMFH